MEIDRNVNESVTQSLLFALVWEIDNHITNCVQKIEQGLGY